MICLFAFASCSNETTLETTIVKDKDTTTIETPTEAPTEAPTETPTDGKELIGLDVTAGTQKYELNSNLDTSALKAYAVYASGEKEEVTSDVTINQSKYNKAKDGTYEIIISYQKNDVTVYSFFFAVVGTGTSSGSGSGDGGDKNFGAGTYTFNASTDINTFAQDEVIKTNTEFAGGYFVVKGSGAKRSNSTTYSIELSKAGSSWIEFYVTGTATVTIVCSSTNASNTSAIAIFDSENSIVNNNESLTSVTNVTQTTITYTLTTGTYKILSQANTDYSSRGVRIYSFTVIQG